MSIPPRVDKDMIKNYNYSNNNSFRRSESFKSLEQAIQNQINKENLETKRKPIASTGSDKMEDVDIFLTLILKNLDPNERILLLNLLLKINWEEAEESLEAHLNDVIDRKSQDDDGHNIYEYDQFLWDFRNWKNFFVAKK